MGNSSTLSVVVHQQQLVNTDRRQQHRAVIVQSSVPDAILKLKQMLESRVKWFHAHIAPLVQAVPVR